MENAIMLNQLLNFSEEQLKNTKVRLNGNNGKVDPIDKFKEDPKNLLFWNFYNTTKKSYNNTKYSIGLVDMKENRWLLFTVAEITKDLNLLGGVGYEYKEIEKFKPLFGRVVVKYKNKVQNRIRRAVGIMHDLEVLEILPNSFTGEDFSGYDNVLLSYSQLKTALTRNKTYINAFENQKAVYLISDTNTGKLYVGSATSKKSMLLSRWKTYIKNGHGDNKRLKAIYEDTTKGFDYIKKYFQYSIIENYNQKTSDDFILKRENYWKKVLLSKKFGYNDN